MRNLATVQKIEWIRPIEGRDRIVLAGILGWQVIVTKDIGNVGDKVVYCEIDSVLPEKPEFEFLRKNKFRIRTMKMAGTISQGICFPLSILPEREEPYEIGEDVTDLVGVTKYDPQDEEEWYKNLKPEKKQKKWYQKLPLMKYQWYRRLLGDRGRAPKNGFPSFISKTDETRIQTVPWMLEDGIHNYVVTEKIDGTSGTFALLRHKRFLLPDKFEYIVCSRNMRLCKDNSIYWQVSDKYQIEAALKNLIGNRDWVAIQGECIGPKIQKNKYKVTEPDLYVFNLVYPEGRKGSVYAAGLLETRGFKFVPILDKAFALPKTVDEMIAYAHGDSVIGPTLREGVVVRDTEGVRSFKAVDPEFLLKYNE